MRSGLSLKPSYYEALKRLTLELAGVHLGQDHAFLVETRLAGIAKLEGYDNLSDMIEELFSAGGTRLAVQVVTSLIERDSHFNRDNGGLSVLFDTALPELIRVRGGGSLRVLSFACASGQEAYSVAMRLANMPKLTKTVRIEVHGVDYPSLALERARDGRYTHFEVQRGLPARDLVRHFEQDGSGWRIKDDLRQSVKFHDAHLLADMKSLGAFHAVLFRGQLAHYSETAALRVFRSLANLVEPFGYLILGSDEKLGGMNYGFDAVDGVSNMYRRREILPEEPEPDPNIKVPNGRTTFDGAKRKKHA